MVLLTPRGSRNEREMIRGMEKGGDAPVEKQPWTMVLGCLPKCSGMLVSHSFCAFLLTQRVIHSTPILTFFFFLNFFGENLRLLNNWQRLSCIARLDTRNASMLLWCKNEETRRMAGLMVINYSRRRRGRRSPLSSATCQAFAREIYRNGTYRLWRLSWPSILFGFSML